MAKKIKAVIKLYCPAGQANPAPPVGPALGQHGLNIMDFCKKFNEKTKGQEGLILPAVISVYEDRSFSFIVKTPPSSVLIKRACGIAKASGEAGKVLAGQITCEHAKEIANIKLKDLNTKNVDQAIKIIAGTARSMGIEIVEKIEKKPEEADDASKPDQGTTKAKKDSEGTQKDAKKAE
ncbi:MAG: 50S ribosomal protein L11 [Candidatus Omnitrophica bacterium]|nr:50S ribosomal protein L11 [Candidatus Omnitrophota bacterium]